MNDLKIADNPLATLRDDIRRHWKKYLPQMTARLQEQGLLEERIESAASATEKAILRHVQQSANSDLPPAQAFWQAWEIYRNEWAFLPAEPKPGKKKKPA